MSQAYSVSQVMEKKYFAMESISHVRKSSLNL